MQFVLLLTPYSEKGQSSDSSQKESKKKKKKKNKKSGEKDSGKNENKEKEDKNQPQQSRTFGNGMVVEEISMGRPDGKKASPGSKVCLYFL